jgi:glycosyltransferase involved in cell wall biosynthesis
LLSGALPSRIICCAEAARASHVQLGYAAHKMIVIGNGVETDRYLPSAAARRSARAEWGTRPEQPVIGMVGRYHRVKNHAGFLQMAQRIRQQVPDAHFVLAGEGVDSANAELMALISSAALGPAVTLLGRQSAMHQVFPGLDLLVSASLTEGFPNVIAEAMSCGVVCVGTDVGDTRRIIGDCGLLASLPDADELASNVIGLLSLPADSRRELSERGRRRILEDFSMKTAAARYAEVYDGLRSR